MVCLYLPITFDLLPAENQLLLQTDISSQAFNTAVSPPSSPYGVVFRRMILDTRTTSWSHGII
jgi:hypothetical protein